MKTSGRIKLCLAVLLLVELLLLLAAFTPFGIDRPSAARAWHKWKNEPSQKSEDNWNAEKAGLRRETAAFDTIVWILLIVNTGALAITAKRLRL